MEIQWILSLLLLLIEDSWPYSRVEQVLTLSVLQVSYYKTVFVPAKLVDECLGESIWVVSFAAFDTTSDDKISIDGNAEET